jgi:hypothetical protein
VCVVCARACRVCRVCVPRHQSSTTCGSCRPKTTGYRSNCGRGRRWVSAEEAALKPLREEGGARTRRSHHTSST